ncbi:thermonuclease family protein [Rubellimicrobium sp. CFH 75288]|nr:thermonuclease family protein [Rubellimicrobium sp. CFH 75288]
MAPSRVLVTWGDAVLAERSGGVVSGASEAVPRADGLIRGVLRVMDGDTVELAGQRVRLHGVDAPEAGQTCEDATGRPWDCGAWATAEARARWDGRPARCEPLDTDRYGRIVARCHVGAEDLGATLVREGMAIAYRAFSLDYVAQEEEARARGAGLWQGRFEEPAAWRAAMRAGQGAAPPSECRIKGNISANGRIYHLPGGLHYDRTTIDPARGERWFCSEEEAQAAGWRPAAR